MACNYRNTGRRIVLFTVGLLIWASSVGTTSATAAVKTIEAKANNTWDPAAVMASVGDVVEWKLGAGTHGVRITNWAAVKDHVEVETVAGQEPFDATAGRNTNPTATAGKVLLRLKVKTAPPAPAEITYNCIVHGAGMAGKVNIAAGAAVKTIEAKANNTWDPAAVMASVGDVVEWTLGAGTHGVRITNWAAIKDHVEVETVAGQEPFDATIGRNPASTATAGKVLLRLKVKTAPPAPAEITYNCIVHGAGMAGKVTVAAANPKDNPIPNVKLKTQDNKEVLFYDDLVKDKIVVINLMYTQCETCEKGTKNLVQLQKALGSHLNRDVFMYSITLDPQNDSPEVLKAYAEKHGAKPGWTFLTGKEEDVAAIRKRLGLSTLSAEMRAKIGLAERNLGPDATQKFHTGMIVIGHDAFNRWTKTSALTRPDQILQIIERMKPPSQTKK